MIFRLSIVKYGSLSTFPIISFVNVSFLFLIIYINCILSEIKINKLENEMRNLEGGIELLDDEFKKIA